MVQKLKDVKYNKHLKDADTPRVLAVMMWCLRMEDKDCRFTELRIKLRKSRCDEWEYMPEKDRQEKKEVYGALFYTMKGRRVEAPFDKRMNPFYNRVAECVLVMHTMELQGYFYPDYSKERVETAKHALRLLLPPHLRLYKG